MGFLERNFHNPTKIYDIKICGNSIYVYSLQKHISGITKLLFALSWKKERNKRILRIQKTQKRELNKIQIWWTQINITTIISIWHFIKVPVCACAVNPFQWHVGFSKNELKSYLRVTEKGSVLIGLPWQTMVIHRIWGKDIILYSSLAILPAHEHRHTNQVIIAQSSFLDAISDWILTRYLYHLSL